MDSFKQQIANLVKKEDFIYFFLINMNFQTESYVDFVFLNAEKNFYRDIYDSVISINDHFHFYILIDVRWMFRNVNKADFHRVMIFNDLYYLINSDFVDSFFISSTSVLPTCAVVIRGSTLTS